MKQLRFTTTMSMSFAGVFNPKEDFKPLALPTEIGEIIQDKLKGKNIYIHGDAEDLAGFDIPLFIDGNLGQLDLPIEQQDILMCLPNKTYKCKAEYYSKYDGFSTGYLITLFDEPFVYEDYKTQLGYYMNMKIE